MIPSLVATRRLPRAVLTRLLSFARTLRRAGLKIGTAQVLDAAAAVETVGLESRGDLRAALASVLLLRVEDRELFDQAFGLAFGTKPELNAALELLLPVMRMPVAADDHLLRRLADAVATTAPERALNQSRLNLDASLTSSSDEQLRDRDFEQMSASEMAAALALLRRPQTLDYQMRTRRMRPTSQPGRLDLRATLRHMARAPDGSVPRWREVQTRPQALVLICDISGSMSAYVRAFLHFAHTLVAHHRRVYVFTFATRLTHLSREFRARDVDRAMAKAGRTVRDWDGGTKIGACLGTFNQLWGRRVLSQGATVILLTDGLERGDPELLSAEVERLRRSCRRLVWLNPLLRFADYSPAAQGARVLVSCVDEILPAHNVTSLRDFASFLGAGLPTHGTLGRRSFSGAQ